MYERTLILKSSVDQRDCGCSQDASGLQSENQEASGEGDSAFNQLCGAGPTSISAGSGAAAASGCGSEMCDDGMGSGVAPLLSLFCKAADA